MIKLPPYSIRNDTDNIEELASSIQANGLLQPIIVRPKGKFFELVAGGRRLKACKLLGWRTIPCIVIEMSDKEAFEVSLIENIQRKSMDPIEEAIAFKKYVEEYGWGTITELAKKIHKSPSYVSKRIQLLNLPKEVIEQIIKKKRNPSIAEELLSLDEPKEQIKVSEIVSELNLSLRETRKIVKLLRNKDNKDEYSFSRYAEIERKNKEILKALERAIVTLRTALVRLDDVLNRLNDSDLWMIYDIIMQHRMLLHNQIDSLIIIKSRHIKKLNKPNYRKVVEEIFTENR
jgi:ParB family chromosome partitioning protein